MKNYMPMGMEFNGDVLKDLKDIEEQLSEEEKKTTADKEKLMKLYMKQLYRGLELNSGYRGNNYRAMFPY